jgi:pyruvate/2-oxoglutarate dehydrogenase complex dihydrolipoamide acyltransferase (E2) component
VNSVDLIVEPGQLGEEADADLIKWLVPDGSEVVADQPVVELSTAKVVVQLVAPANGVLTYLKPAGSVVEVGTTIGRIQVT